MKQNKIDQHRETIYENILSKIESQANQRMLETPEVEMEETHFKKIKSEDVLTKDLIQFFRVIVK